MDHYGTTVKEFGRRFDFRGGRFGNILFIRKSLPDKKTVVSQARSGTPPGRAVCIISEVRI